MNTTVSLIILILLGFLCSYIHKNKGYSPVSGFLWGFFFTILGLIVVLLEKNKGEDKGKLSMNQWLLIFLGIGIGIILIILFFMFV